MKSKQIAFIGFAAVFAACGSSTSGYLPSDSVEEDGDEYIPWDGADGKSDQPLFRLAFTNACVAGPKLIVSAVGDVLLHSPLQKQAYASAIGVRSLWSEVEPLIAKAHVSYANLEGPAAAGVNASGRIRLVKATI